MRTTSLEPDSDRSVRRERSPHGAVLPLSPFPRRRPDALREPNLLLGILPDDLLSLVGVCLDVVPIVQGQSLGTLRTLGTLGTAGGVTRDVYFPRSGAISLVARLGTGRLIEVESVGTDGVAGLSTVFGGVSGFEAVGQLPGEAARMRADVFRAFLREFRPMRRALLQYTDVVLAQAHQAAVCHASHRIEERCARWLLVAHDRVGRDELPITHEFLALMLGVRRASVTVALGLLRRAGSISHSRAVVRVVDRAALEGASCECYRSLRAGHERIARAVQRRVSVADA
jgi:CRP-like cAMP-binding protein